MADSSYSKLIEKVFQLVHKPGSKQAEFKRELLAKCAEDLGIKLPKNLGDVLYSFRYRKELPDSIKNKAPKGLSWVIRPGGDGIYRFVAIKPVDLKPSENLIKTKIPDATPGIISAFALGDEQALLAKLRYNRLVDIFTRVACYSLQNHLRTKIPEVGQIEVDELYLGVDRRGAQYVIPIQAKGGRDKLSVVQIEQDIQFCAHRFPQLICRPVGAQFMRDDTIALMEFAVQDEQVVVMSEAHYKLVPHDRITDEDRRAYRVLAEPESSS